MVSLLKEIIAQAFFWAMIFLIIICAWAFPARSTDLLDPNGNAVTLMTGFCHKTKHFGPCKVVPHRIKPKVKQYLWDKMENPPNQVVVDVSVG